MKNRIVSIFSLLLWNLCVIVTSAQTPYDSFAPETTRPMLTSEALSREKCAQDFSSDTTLLVAMIDTQQERILLVDMSDGSIVAYALLTDNKSHWLSPDPLLDKYPEISPYAYCANNPMKYVDPDGKNPVYSTDGELIGTDENGLQGLAIVMNIENFTQNMSSEEAKKNDMGIDALSFKAYQKYYESYKKLSSRPDWDGKLTLFEANHWYRNGNGESLFVDLSEIDISGIYSLGEKFVGQEKVVNLLTNSKSTETGLVYGNIKLKRYPSHQVRAYSDIYNFEMHNWRNPQNWGRNIETIIGSKVAGDGIPYIIHFYGSQTLTPILPWIK